MENTPAFHPLDYVSVLRRRIWWLITPIVLALLVGTALAMLLPRSYVATATLGISLPELGQQVVSDAQRLTGQERTRNFNQVLLSPPVVERVVKEEGLDKTMSLEDAVEMVSAGTEVRLPPPDPGVAPGNVEQYFVDFTHRDPAIAQRVANRLAEVFIDESTMKRTVRAEATAMFLHDQLQESQAKLHDLEERLRVAQETFMGSLPEQTQSNIALVQGLQQQLAGARNSYRTENDRLAWIERQLAGSKPTLPDDPAGPQVPGVAAGPASTRVLALERELASARQTYTEKHPEVTRILGEIAIAKREAAEEASKPEEVRFAAARVDPEYRNLVTDREQTKLRISALQAEQESLQKRIDTLTAAVQSAPLVEQRVASLKREYELEKGIYASLNAKLQDAELTEGVERSQGGERFAILARAGYPSEPSSPDVPRLMIITMLLGICLGGALALGREYLDRSIHDARALHDLELPVLGEIPRISHV